MNIRRRTRSLAGLALVLLLGFGRPALPGQERFRRVPPQPDPLPELRLPNIENVTLANGLNLSTVYREGQPFINIQMVILAGESESPKSLPGIATFTANMVPRGTDLLSATDIQDRIESWGGQLSITTRLDYALITVQVLEEYLDQALDLLSQMILRPAFSEKELAAVKYTMYYDLLNQEKDAAFVARRHLFRELLRNHRYANGFFNKEAVKNIRLQNVADFFRAHYSPALSRVILTGNISLRSATHKVSHFFNTWPRGPSSPPTPGPPPPNLEPRVVFLNVPGADDCILFAGNIVPAMTSPDYFSLAVFNQILGGSVNSRLILNLREAKGYAYYVFSQLDPFPGFSLFLIRARVAPEALFASVQEILNEIRANRDDRLPISDIEQAKTTLIGSFPLSFERLASLSERITESKVLGLGDDYWSRYYENAKLVNGERVFEVVQALNLQTPVIVIAGDKSVMADQLRFFDKVDIYDAQGTFQYSLKKETDK